MPLAPGQVLQNRYRIDKLLGQGGFGAVYQAWDINLKCPRALKENLNTSPEAKSQFLLEAQILDSLSHPYLPKVIDHFNVPSQGQYLVMSYIDGDDLERIVQQRGALPPSQVLVWIGQVCDALTYLHTRQPPVIHRDIKPANIRITPGGGAVLVDFGIAKIFDPVAGTLKGARGYTPGYASPEQQSGKGTDALSDIYSLGATTYHLLTGLIPPDTNDITAGLEPEPLPAHQINPGVSVPVGQAVKRAMQLNRAGRPQTVEEFKAALLAPPQQPKHAPLPAHIPTPAAKQARPSTVQVPPYQPLPRGQQAHGRILAPSPAQPKKQWLGGSLLALIMLTILVLLVVRPWSENSTFHSPTPTASRVPIETQVSPIDGMAQVFVPAGPFLMGSKSSEQWVETIEFPQHTVTLDAFWIDKTEVTNAQYAKCVADGACQPPSNMTSKHRSAYYNHSWYANFPVIYVSWTDAKAYCRWAGRRLPTEAEWEKAARGENGQIYPWGNQEPTCSMLNFMGCVGDTAAVGSYLGGASPYGALDMGGNVLEWVADWYQSNYYQTAPVNNPPGPSSGSSRVLRGGAYEYHWLAARAGRRDDLNPAYGGNNTSGFRCARSP